ncbi:MAG: hypothetical protein AABY22_28035, partial [Nanoarchaeota archaeon]
IKRKINDDEYVLEHNYLNFDIKNFNVEEKGCLIDIIDQSSQDDAQLEDKKEEKEKVQNGNKGDPK